MRTKTAAVCDQQARSECWSERMSSDHGQRPCSIARGKKEQEDVKTALPLLYE